MLAPSKHHAGWHSWFPVNTNGMSDNQCTWTESHPGILCIDVNIVRQHELEDCIASAIDRVPHWHAVLQPHCDSGKCNGMLAERLQN